MQREVALTGFAATDFLHIDKIRQLKNFFGSLESAWENATPDSLEAAGVRRTSAELFCEKKRHLSPESLWGICERKNIHILCWEDEAYPELLRTIESPPAVLFFRGKLGESSEKALALVGSRNISPLGRMMTDSIVPDLVQAGASIVSGLARGIDAAAHRAALRSGGRTIAVLGNGIDRIYPPEHQALADEIEASGGLIFSEFAPKTPPKPYFFPRRNRIVSGLSLGVLVIEGEEKSGSLITAQYALEQNREVFAFPGSPLSASAEGPNRLIQKGTAKLVLRSTDVLEEFPQFFGTSEALLSSVLPELSTEEKTLLGLLGSEPRLFDDILQETTLPPGNLSALLTLLEMKDLVQNFSGNFWAKKGGLSFSSFL